MIIKIKGLLNKLFVSDLEMPENENIFVLDYKLTLIHHAPKIKYVINQNMIFFQHSTF